MATIKSEILSRKFIKPSSPTPPHLKTVKLSLLDQLATSIHGNLTFFFPSDTINVTKSTDVNYNCHGSSDKSHLLQAALSKTLAIFRPLAGRLTDVSTVDCNDKGAFFIEAKIGAHLSKFLNQPNPELVNLLLPSSDPKTTELAQDALLIVQFTSFTCGGVAVSLSLSHKTADMASLHIFIHSWAAIARDTDPYVPEWIGSSLFPPRHGLPSTSFSLSISKGKFVEKRFVFSATKIAQLKAKAMENGKLKRHPSRVEVVLALIWKCAVASSKRRSGSFRPSVMFQAVNLRKRITPPLPDTTMGNFIWPFMVLVSEEKQLEIHELAIKMRKAFNDFCDDNKANKFVGENGHLMILESLKERMEFLMNNEDMNIYRCTSWCRFPLYDTDFGWGEPVWHASVNRMVSNTISLADTRSRDGIEVVLTLDEEEMAIFGSNDELLQFACGKPSIPVCFKAAL